MATVRAAITTARRAVAGAAAGASRAASARFLHDRTRTATALAATAAPRAGGTRRQLTMVVAAGAATAAVGLTVASADASPAAHTAVRRHTPQSVPMLCAPF